MNRRILHTFILLLGLLVLIVTTRLHINTSYSHTTTTLNEPTLLPTIYQRKTSDNNKIKKFTPKILCRSRPEYYQRKNIPLDPKTVDGVEIMLMFIGYPRSGHSLIGSLLDAHPNVVIANEYDIIHKWQNYTAKHRNKQYLFEQLYTNSYVEAREGDRSTEDCLPKTRYKYLVPNQWQGKFNGTIKVIGDKKGGHTTQLLFRSPRHMSMLTEISQAVNITMKFIHVIRNPFDNVATIMLRKVFGYNLNWSEVYKNPVKVSKAKFLQRIKYHMRFAEGNTKFLRKFPSLIHTLRSEDVIMNPNVELRKLCKYLNIQCSENYISDSVSIVKRRLSRSRNGIIWDKEAKHVILNYIQKIPFYKNYTFDE